MVKDIRRLADIYMSDRSRLFPYQNRYQFVLKHGRPFIRKPLPEIYETGYPKQCYGNACQLVRKYPDDLFYAEGFGVPNRSGCFILEHAWAVDAQGNVIDPTWEPVGRLYFGVVFDFDYLKRVTYSGRRYTPLIDNFNERWPLIDGRHTDWMPRSDKAPVSNEKWW